MKIFDRMFTHKKNQTAREAVRHFMLAVKQTIETQKIEDANLVEFLLSTGLQDTRPVDQAVTAQLATVAWKNRLQHLNALAVLHNLKAEIDAQAEDFPIMSDLQQSFTQYIAEYDEACRNIDKFVDSKVDLVIESHVKG